MRDAGKLVVARYRDGRTVAGRLDEFRAESPSFRVLREGGEWTTVSAEELKALSRRSADRRRPGAKKSR